MTTYTINVYVITFLETNHINYHSSQMSDEKVFRVVICDITPNNYMKKDFQAVYDIK